MKSKNNPKKSCFIIKSGDTANMLLANLAQQLSLSKVAQRSASCWPKSHHVVDRGLRIFPKALQVSYLETGVRSRMYIIEQGNIVMTPPKRLSEC